MFRPRTQRYSRGNVLLVKRTRIYFLQLRFALILLSLNGRYDRQRPRDTSNPGDRIVCSHRDCSFTRSLLYQAASAGCSYPDG
jgi:hypothetical protein